MDPLCSCGLDSGFTHLFYSETCAQDAIFCKKKNHEKSEKTGDICNYVDLSVLSLIIHPIIKYTDPGFVSLTPTQDTDYIFY